MKSLAERILPSTILSFMKRVKATLFACFMNFLEWAGYLVARAGDYYSPLVSVPRLRSSIERWNRPSALVGIDYDVEEMKLQFSDLLSRYLNEFSHIPPYGTLQKVGFGPGYTGLPGILYQRDC